MRPPTASSSTRRARPVAPDQSKSHTAPTQACASRRSRLTARGRSLLVEEAAFATATGNAVDLFAVTGAEPAEDVSAVDDLSAAPAATSREATGREPGRLPRVLRPPPGETQTNPLLDNFEGMAITGHSGGLTGISMISDDNFSAAQTTRVLNLLVKLPYLASLVSPTPLIVPSSASVAGGAAAICRSVASWKITYAGTPCSLAVAARQARSRSNTGAASARQLARRPPPRPRPARPDRRRPAVPAAGPAFGGSRRSMTWRSPRSTSPLVGQRQRAVVALDREQPWASSCRTTPRHSPSRQLGADAEHGQRVVAVAMHPRRLLAEQDVDRLAGAERWSALALQPHHGRQQLLRGHRAVPGLAAASGRCRSCRTARRVSPK